MSKQPKVMTWAGWILTLFIAFFMAFAAVMSIRDAPEVAENFVGKFGYPGELAVTIGIVLLSCVVLYVIPQTAILGAVLLTGYLGGAVATHVRVKDNFAAAVVTGVVVWLAL